MAVEALARGGHSSMPPIDHSSAAATLARVISSVDKNPSPESLVPPVTHFLRSIARVAPFYLRGLLAQADNKCASHTPNPSALSP
jgi:hypothetical protein